MSVTGDPQADFAAAVKRICAYSGVEFEPSRVEPLKNLECVGCGIKWSAVRVESCGKCETHLCVRDIDTVKRTPAATRPAGMSDEEWRHDCEVRYWAGQGVMGETLFSRLSKKRSRGAALKVVEGVDAYLSKL